MAGHIQAVDKAIQLMELLANHGQPISLTQASAQTGWPKSTVHGLLATLRHHGIVEQANDTGYYYLGARFFEMAARAQGNLQGQ